MYTLNQITSINLEALSALAAWVEIMIIFIPAVGYFLYSKFCFVDCWVFNESSNGMYVAIHNKNRSSLFILQEEICVKKNHNNYTYSIPLQSNCEMDKICIKPDDIVYFNIDYEMYHISSMDQVSLYIQFGGKRRKKKKKIKRGISYVRES